MYRTPIAPLSIEELDQLQSHSEQLTAAVKSIATLHRNIESSEQQSASHDMEEESIKARANILASIGGIKTLLDGPHGFLQHLASQVCSLCPFSPCLPFL